MKSETNGLADWLKTPQGAYLLGWERAQFDLIVSDIFGYHALQLGLPELDTLMVNRMPHRWLALETLPGKTFDDASEPGTSDDHSLMSAAPGIEKPASSSRKVAFLADSGALPFPEASLDLVVLPHTLELGRDAHATLREVERVLVPEGKVVISGFNPVSLWGLSQRRRHFFKRGSQRLYLPQSGEFIGYWRLRDWLRLLNFEVETAQFGCYRPALSSPAWLERFKWMDTLGERWWPIFGAVYFLAAVKRVHGVRLLEPAWKSRKAAATAPAAITNRGARGNRPSDA